LQKKVNAQFIFRGLRSGVDFEYEKPIAETNLVLNPHINTVFLLTHKEFGMISSSIVREIIKNNGKANKFLPECVKL
jgi:pantetheine-phosphate adenylyltransferase